MTDPDAYLRILGEPGLERPDGTEVDLPLGKPFALLVYLLLVPDPPSRETLARIFWPDSTRERARASVRQALWLLRSTLGEDLFVADDPVEVRPGAVRTDVGDIRRALARDDVERAYALWRGAPLEPLNLVDLPEWERWIDALRGELEQRLAEGAALRGNRCRDTGDLTDALRWLRRAREIRPHLLQHHLDLAEACLESRRFDEAAEALHVARRHLVDDEELHALAEIEERLQTLRRGSLGDPLQDDALRLEFVGRSEEFAALVRRWRQARAGHAAVALVTGEDGIGKTRLTEELALLARTDRGRTVQVGAADGERPIEWGLLGELVQQLMALSGAAGISHASDGMLRALLPSLSVGGPPGSGAPVGPAEADGGQARPSAALSDALHDLVTAVSEDAPLLIVIEDLHWADAESRAILARVASHLESVPVLLLVTCRACDEDDQLKKTKSLLASTPNGTAITLGPWKVEEMEAVFAQFTALTGSEAERGAIERVTRISRGVPAYALEILRRLQSEGVLDEREDGEGVFHAEKLDSDPPLPDGLLGWVRSCIPELTGPAFAVALAVARAGSPVALPGLPQRSELTPEMIGNGIGELLELRLAHWHREDQLALIHHEVASAVLRHARSIERAAASGRSGWPRAWAAALAGLALIGVTSATYVFGEPEPVEPRRIGEGSLYVIGPDSSFTLDAFGGPEPRWESAAIESWFPVGNNIVGPFRTTNGRLHWFENHYAAGAPSWIVDLGTTGTDTAVGDHPLDERFLDLSPSGRFYLSVSPHPEFPESRDDLRASVRRRSTSWPFHRANGKILSADWSDDARAIALGVREPDQDVVVVLGVTAQQLSRRQFGEVYNAVWCGGSREIVVAASDGDVPQLLRWDVETEVVEVLLTTEVLGRSLTCAPDGSAVVFQTAEDGAPRYAYLDRTSGEVSYLPLPGGTVVQQLRWVPDVIEAVPIAVVIHEGESLTMQWGDRVDLGADLVLSNWERSESDEVSWATRDPEIASVGPDGEVTANTAGVTEITASYGDWLVDVLRVTVEGEPTPKTLFSSTLGTMDRGDWLPVGMPDARTVRLGGRSVLELRGDGSEPTGVISTQSFALPRGGTIEADFRVAGLLDQETEADARASVELCLLDADAPSTGVGDALEADSFHSWQVRQRVCFSYPHGSPPRMDPGAASLRSHTEFPSVRADVSADLPTEDWFRVAVLLRSDGTARFLVNDAYVGTTPVQVQVSDAVRWRIAVFGAGAEPSAHPLVRDLTLSEGGHRKKHHSDDGDDG